MFVKNSKGKNNSFTKAVALLCAALLLAGTFSFYAFIPNAYAAVETWADDLAEWRSYGTNGWTETSGIPRWTGNNVASNLAAGDPTSNAMVIPQLGAAEAVTYKRIDVLAGNILSMPVETTENIQFYEIYFPAQLRWAVANRQSFKLMNDLDMGGNLGYQWTVVSQGATRIFMNGNGHTIYNLAGSGFIGGNSQPLIMKDLHFSSCNLTDSIFNGTMSNTYISIENVSLEHAVINTSGHGGGLIKRAYFRPNGSYARVYANNCHTRNVYVQSTACTGNFAGPISGVVENCYALDGTMRSPSHSGAFTSCAGNYIFENCFTNVRAYGSTVTGAFVGHPEDSLYAPGGDRTSKFINCYAAGFIEGVSDLGGFAGGLGTQGAACSYLFENCYSTAMVGMQNNGTYQGGFVGRIESGQTATMRNCYASGEVGSVTTNATDTSPMGGFIGAIQGNLTLENCFYDKQTTAMREKWRGGTGASNGIATGLLTKDLMAILPDGLPAEDSAWVLTDGTYPQLRVFADNTTYSQADKDIADAYSKASVCTAILYPSSLGQSAFEVARANNDYDTVRDIRFLFPFTNNYYAGTSADTYDISWMSHGDKSTATGMTNVDVIVLNSGSSQNRPTDYSVASLAPGIGWVTVYVDHNNVIGQRRLRLIPTSTITITEDPNATATTGTNAHIYAIPEGETIDDLISVNFLEYKNVIYDHLIGVIFAAGSTIDLVNVKTDTLAGHPYPTTPEEFNAAVYLKTTAENGPGGAVQVLVSKLDENGEWQELLITQSDVDLFTSVRPATSEDIGQYRFSYRWYGNPAMIGEEGGYLLSEKILTIDPAITVVYLRNYDDGDNTVVALPSSAIPAGQQTLYYKEGDELQVLPADPAPAREGFRLVGWSLDREGTPGRWLDTHSKTSFDWAGDNNVVTAYAIWSNYYTVTIKDGSYESSAQVQYHNKLLDNLTSRSALLPYHGRTLLGWSTTEDAGVPDINPEDLITGDVVVYPVWAPVPGATKGVNDLVNPPGGLAVDSVLEYVITASNTSNNSLWKDVVIKDMIPPSVQLVPGSIKLTKPGEITPISLPDSEVFNPVTNLLTVPVGDVASGQTYILTFEVIVEEIIFDITATPEERDIGNTATIEGKDINGDPVNTGTNTVYPSNTDPGNMQGLQDPDGTVRKGVINPTHPTVTYVQDRLIYTIVAENLKPDSVWNDVVIYDRVPYGMDLDTDSMYLQKPDGTIEHINASAYDILTRTIAVPVGDIYGGQSYFFTFALLVTAEVLVPNDEGELPDLGNIGEATGRTPGGGGYNRNSGRYTYPPGVWRGGGVLSGENPYPWVHKSAYNNNHGDKTRVGDRISYTIEAGNTEPNTMWSDVVIEDILPTGLQIILDSMFLTLPDGTIVQVHEDAYDASTRILSVYVGDLWTDEVCTLSFDAIVSLDAIGRDIGNYARGYGGRAGGRGSGHIPGERYSPEGEAEIAIETDDPVYPLEDDEILPTDPDPHVTKEVENITTPSNEANLEDILLYTVTLTNPRVGSLWRNVFIFDYLPPELVLDLDSMTLIRPDGSRERVGRTVFNAAERTIIVPIAQIWGGETWTFTYRAAIATDDAVFNTTQREIVNRVVVEGENPDGTPIPIVPESSVTIPYTPTPRIIPQTGDPNDPIIWTMALLSALLGVVCLLLFLKRQQTWLRLHYAIVCPREANKTLRNSSTHKGFGRSSTGEEGQMAYPQKVLKTGLREEIEVFSEQFGAKRE